MQKVTTRDDTTDEATGGRARWVRLGVISATTMAPLIARWNELRAEERAREARSVAVVRLQAVRDLASGWNLPNVRLPFGAESVPPATTDPARLANIISLATERAKRGLDTVGTQAADRAPWASSLVGRFTGGRAAQPAPKKDDDRPNVNLWLFGVAIGLTAAGVAAYVIARQRMTATPDDGPMVELPANGRPAVVGARVGRSDALGKDTAMTRNGMDTGGDGGNGGPVPREEGARQGSENAQAANAPYRSDTGTRGIGNVPTSDAAAPNGPNSSTDAMPPARGTSAAAGAARKAPRQDVASRTLEEVAADSGVTSTADIDNAADAAVAPFVGNIRTLIYHPATDDNRMPTEENRVYFGSEEEAIQAGYHRAKDDVASTTTP